MIDQEASAVALLGRLREEWRGMRSDLAYSLSLIRAESLRTHAGGQDTTPRTVAELERQIRAFDNLISEGED